MSAAKTNILYLIIISRKYIVAAENMSRNDESNKTLKKCVGYNT